METECRCCFYRMYNLVPGKSKECLKEEPVPNCNRNRCLMDGTDITRFINNGWLIKLREEDKK